METDTRSAKVLTEEGSLEQKAFQLMAERVYGGF